MSPSGWILLHLGCTAWMSGVICICNRVHYPLMRYAHPQHFVEFSRQHQRRISWVVVPLMIAELVSAIMLALSLPGQRIWTGAGLALLLAIWVSTAASLAPTHQKLLSGYDEALLDQLCKRNRFRTYAWYMRLGVAAYLSASCMNQASTC